MKLLIARWEVPGVYETTGASKLRLAVTEGTKTRTLIVEVVDVQAAFEIGELPA